MAVYLSIYTSLYPTLQQRHIDKLEDALRASLLGRFNDAQAFFDHPTLPPSHTLPVLALERSRAYGDQALHKNIVDLLTKALEYSKAEELGRVRWLMRLKLCQAQIFLSGYLDAALDEARTVRGFLTNIPLEDYTDIDVALVQAYHQIMDIGRKFSNWVHDIADSQFPPVADRSPWKGITQLRCMLQRRGRYREAMNLIYMAERFFASGGLFLRDLDQICDAIEASGDVVSTMTARVFLFERLAQPGVGMGMVALQKVTKLRETLVKHYGQSSVATLDHRINVAKFNINHPSGKRCTQFLEFARAAHRLGDHLDERAHLCAAATEVVTNGSPPHVIEDVVSQFLDFESKTTQCSLFLAIALGDIGYRCCIVNKRPSEYMRLFNDFNARFPGFDVPIQKGRLFSSAVLAVRELGDYDALPYIQGCLRSLFNQYPVGHARDEVNWEAMKEGLLKEEKPS